MKSTPKIFLLLPIYYILSRVSIELGKFYKIVEELSSLEGSTKKTLF